MKYALLLAFAGTLSITAHAGPAAWFKWHSPEADYEICAQFSPGDGWRIVKGPFEDSACRKPLRQ